MEKISTQLKGDSRGLGIFFGRCSLVGKKGDVQRKRRRMHNHTSNNA